MELVLPRHCTFKVFRFFTCATLHSWPGMRRFLYLKVIFGGMPLAIHPLAGSEKVWLSPVPLALAISKVAPLVTGSKPPPSETSIAKPFELHWILRLIGSIGPASLICSFPPSTGAG